MVVVHDGVQGTVVDALSKQPVEGAFVYDYFEFDGRPHVLALSDPYGRVQLEPTRRLEFVILLGEANVFQTLWICKDGYVPVEVGGRGGWNADFLPSQVFNVGTIELVHSNKPAGDSCTRETHQELYEQQQELYEQQQRSGQ